MIVRALVVVTPALEGVVGCLPSLTPSVSGAVVWGEALWGEALWGEALWGEAFWGEASRVGFPGQAGARREA